MVLRDAPVIGRGIEMDRVQWPLVVFHVPSGPWSPHLDHYFRDLLSCFDVGRSFAQVLDLSAADMPEAQVRRRLADFQREHLDLYGHYLLGQAVIAPLPELRGLVTSINWASEAPMPQGTFPTTQEGIAWASEQIQRRYPRFVYLSDLPPSSSETRIRR